MCSGRGWGRPLAKVARQVAGEQRRVDALQAQIVDVAIRLVHDLLRRGSQCSWKNHSLRSLHSRRAAASFDPALELHRAAAMQTVQ